MSNDLLKLSNQLCFPVYAASRLITRQYQPYLDQLGITYPQYLVLMVLWESDAVTVNDIAEKLILNTNTLTPLLKRMEVMGLLERRRSESDERKVVVSLTEKGIGLREKARVVPESLLQGLQQSPLSLEQLLELKSNLDVLIDFLRQKGKDGGLTE